MLTESVCWRPPSSSHYLLCWAMAAAVEAAPVVECAEIPLCPSHLLSGSELNGTMLAHHSYTQPQMPSTLGKLSSGILPTCKGHADRCGALWSTICGWYGCFAAECYLWLYEEGGGEGPPVMLLFLVTILLRICRTDVEYYMILSRLNSFWSYCSLNLLVFKNVCSLFQGLKMRPIRVGYVLRMLFCLLLLTGG